MDTTESEEKVEGYEATKQAADSFYKSIGRIRCPALNNEYIHFTSEGFNHLIYSDNKERGKKIQMAKFRHLPDAKKVLLKTVTIQEQDTCLEMKKVKMGKKKEVKAIEVHYWAFLAIVRNRRVKVVVRQVGTGQKHFYSVIPIWGISHYSGNRVIEMSSGNLKND